MINFYEIVSLFEEEEIVGSFRSHAIVLVKPLLPFAIVLLLAFLFMFPLFHQGLWGVLFFLLVLGVDAAMIGRKIMSWYGSFFIITNKRLFSITRSGFFKKQVHELALSKIASLSYHTKGIFQTIFKYGNVELGVKEGQESKLELANLPQPQRVLDLISRYVHINDHRGEAPIPVVPTNPIQPADTEDEL